jgi:hypothetical protein
MVIAPSFRVLSVYIIAENYKFVNQSVKNAGSFLTRTVSDWDLSLAHLRSLERAGVIPIGVHLGNENLDKLHKLFPRLVNYPNGEVRPDKLGSMLSSLA